MITRFKEIVLGIFIEYKLAKYVVAIKNGRWSVLRTESATVLRLMADPSFMEQIQHLQSSKSELDESLRNSLKAIHEMAIEELQLRNKIESKI